MSDERTICLICTRSAPSPHGTMTDGSPCPNASRPWPAPQASLPPQGAEPVSSIEAAQRHGYLGEPGEWREACRLYRARCTPGDCDKMAKLRTYIEEGLLVVVRPDRIAAPPQGASSLLPEQERIALVEKCALEVVGFCNQFGDEATDRLLMLRSQLAASPLPAPQEPAMTEAQALVIADKYGQRWKASDEEGISFEKSQFFMFLAALLAAQNYASPAPDSTP